MCVYVRVCAHVLSCQRTAAPLPARGKAILPARRQAGMLKSCPHGMSGVGVGVGGGGGGGGGEENRGRGTETEG